MVELDIDEAELVRRYCAVRNQKGDLAANPNNQRKNVQRVLHAQGNPTFQTLVDLVSALEGNLVLRWQVEVVRLERLQREDLLQL